MKTRLIKAFSSETGILTEDLTGSKRDATISIARGVLWHILRKHGFSFTNIARTFNREHPTVMSGVKNTIGMLECGDKTLNRYLSVIEKLTENFGKIEIGVGQIFELPTGQFITAVSLSAWQRHEIEMERMTGCEDCCLRETYCSENYACMSSEREDKKEVFFAEF